MKMMMKVQVIVEAEAEAEVEVEIVVAEVQIAEVIIMIRKVIKKVKTKNSNLVYIFNRYINIQLFIIF